MKEDSIPGEPDYYLNEKGLVTFTASYLLKRGYCCGSGCRHCPYDYAAVPEPQRTILLSQKQSNGNSEKQE